MAIPSHKEFLSHSVTQPIYLSSNYTFRHESHPERTNFSYSRTRCPNFSALEECIQKLYFSNKTVLTCSGMAAISCIFNSFYIATEECIYVIDKELYCDTPRLLKDMKKKFLNLVVITLDLTDIESLDEVLNKYGSKIKMIYCESMSNPSGRYISTNEIKKKVNHLNIPIVVDNSWLSASYNPLDNGADVLMESLSKYMSSGDVIMGCITGRDEKLMDAIINYTCHNGIRTNPFDAYNIIKSLSTLNFKLEHISKTAYEVAKFLETDHNVSCVMYPMLESHPTYKESQKYVKLGPGIIWFHIPNKHEQILKMMTSSEKILFATSYGKPETLFDPYPKVRSHNGVKGTWVRLAIGYAQSSHEIIDELKNMFSKSFFD